MKTEIKKHGNKWTVRFQQGNQGFILDYKVDTKKEAKWMKDRLDTAFHNFKVEIKREFE